jgi:hypothetical protein
MDSYIWLVPKVFGVMAGAALVLFGAGVAGSVAIRRYRSWLSRIVTGTVLVLLAVAAGVAIRATVESVARALDINVKYLDPGPLGYIAPPAFAALALVVGKRVLKDQWSSGRAFLFYAWLVGFTLLNVVNRCTPGWCETIGFPLSWHYWSDEMVTMGDGGLEKLAHLIWVIVAVAVDLLTFVGVARLLQKQRALASGHHRH